MAVISVPPEAHALALKLFELGADETPVKATPDLIGPNLAALLNKKVAQRSGSARGRAALTTPGTIKLLVKKEDIELGPEPTKRKKRTDAPLAGESLAGSVTLRRSEINNLRAGIQEYFKEIEPENQRSWNHSHQTELSLEKFAGELRGVKGKALLDKMQEIASRESLSFEQYINRKYGSYFVDLFPIPDAGKDNGK